MIVNIISSNKGGGAEILVRELHKIYISSNQPAYTIYFSGNASSLVENELVMFVSPRGPLNIYRIRKLLKQLLTNAQDRLIVHVHLSWPLFYVTLASLGLSNLRLVYTEHSTTNKRRRIPFFWMMERLLYSRYARIICISQGVNDALAKWVGPNIAQRLVTIPNGSRIYSLAKRQSLGNRLPRLVSIGSLSPKKNFSTAIHAVSQLRHEIDRYTIIGEGSERRKLEKIIHNEQLEDKIQLVGWSDAIEPYLHAADIQLIPSLWEGFGLVAVEGMSTGLSVVASNLDGLREVLNEETPSVTLVDQVESIVEWTEAIRKSIFDLREFGPDVLAKSSRRQAENFTLEKMAKRYLDVYRE